MESNKRDEEFSSLAQTSGAVQSVEGLNLQALILTSLKAFVSKDNRARHEKFANDQNYSQYNTDLIFREFIGHKLYSLTVVTPKTYIICEQNGDLKINSEKKSDVTTLNEYLCEAVNSKLPNVNIQKIQDVDFLNPEIKHVLKEAINKLDGIGVLCFMALWLQDLDVFGKNLDNVLVRNNKTVSKIDTSEINFNEDLNQFENGVDALLTQQKYLTHDTMPFFLMIFELLDDMQKQAGVNAISSLADAELRKAVSWITNALGINHKQAEQMYDVLRARRNAILFNSHDYFENKSKIALKSIEQDVIIRPASDFEETTERIKGGRSNPVVSHKVKSEKKDKKILFMCAHSIIKSLLLLLGEKTKTMEKGDKKILLTDAIVDLNDLLSSINIKLTSFPASYKRAELSEVYSKFNKIINEKVYPALDVSDREKLFSAISNIFKKELPTKELTTKEEVGHLQEFLNKKYQGFFESIIPPVVQEGLHDQKDLLKTKKNTKS